MELDLDPLKPPPEFSARSILTIEALAPLSMVAKMPGKYYRSQPEPTDLMLLGLLENALGWHFNSPERDAVLKYLERRHRSRAPRSGVGYASLLQWHVRFAMRRIPDAMHYDDLWAQHLKHNDERHTKGSRNHDRGVIGALNSAQMDWSKVDIKAVRPHFPQYYVSPTPREYVVPNGPYRYTVETSPALAQRLSQAIEDPAAPLYLGSNDGWVEATWEAFP